MIHAVFGIKFRQKNLNYSDDSLYIKHYMDSPNMARLEGKVDMRGFQNKGYFELWGKFDEKHVQIDRSNRKIDLEKLKLLIDQKL